MTFERNWYKRYRRYRHFQFLQQSVSGASFTYSDGQVLNDLDSADQEEMLQRQSQVFSSNFDMIWVPNIPQAEFKSFAVTTFAAGNKDDQLLAGPQSLGLNCHATS